MKGQATATIETIVIVTLHSDDKKLNGKQFERRDTRQVQVTHLSITDDVVDLDYVKLGNHHPGSVMGLKEIKSETPFTDALRKRIQAEKKENVQS